MRTFKSRRWLVLSVVLLASGLFVHQRTHVAWEEMIAHGRELEREVEQLDWTRPVLYGESVEGLARLEYERALQHLSADATEEWISWSENREDEALAGQLRSALVNKNRLMLEAMSEGAHRQDASPEFGWGEGGFLKCPKLLTTRTMVNIAVLASHQYIEEGRPDLAVDQLLDAMQFGHDTMNGTSRISGMIGCALLAISSNEALVGTSRPPSRFLDQVPVAQLGRLAKGMRILDENFTQNTAAGACEIAWFIRTVVRLDAGEDADAVGENTDVVDFLREFLEFGPVGRWRFMNYVQEAERLRSIESRVLHQPWEQVLVAMDEEILGGTSLDQMSTNLQAILPGMIQVQRSTQTTFRLARTAVEFRLTGELPDLRDPFGSAFVVEETEDTLRVESVGPEQDGPGKYYAISLSR